MNVVQQMQCDGFSEDVLEDILAEEEALRARRRGLVQKVVGVTIFLAILALVLGLAESGPDLADAALLHIRTILPR